MNRDNKKPNKEHDFTDLEVWQDAHRLTLWVYSITKKYPKEELYGLTSQTRRATVSVELNIAEGYGRYHFAEEIKFLLNARGSIAEVQSCFLIARDLGFVDAKIANNLYLEYRILSKRINSLINYKKGKKNVSKSNL